jgi:hypothetical protein
VSRVSRTSESLAVQFSVRLPAAGLECRREIELRPHDPVVSFTETVINERAADHFFHWTEHVTLGPQFLDPDASSIGLPGTEAATYPHGYDEGKALLASNARFRWPDAPLSGGGTTDLTQPFIRPGLGFVATVLIDRDRQFGYVAAVNWRLGVLLAYCFRRADFPWIAVWEENLAIAAPPWSGRTRARGLEFGTTPFPLPRRESFLAAPLFGEPTLTYVPASGTKIVRYIAVMTRVLPQVRAVRDIVLDSDRLRIVVDSGPAVIVRSPAVERLLV